MGIIRKYALGKRLVFGLYSAVVAIGIFGAQPSAAWALEGSELLDAQSQIASAAGSWQNPLSEGEFELKQDKGLALPSAVESADSLYELKSVIHSNMTDRNESFEIHYTGDTGNLEADLTAILDQIDSEDEYLANSRSGYSWGCQGYVNDVQITFNVGYLHSRQDEEYIESETDKILADIIKDGMNDLDKLKAVNDYIVLNTQYSKDTIASAHSPYAILTEGKGVCQAYALLEYKMLYKLGFDCRYVGGHAGGEGHAWNMAKLDGSWYFIDSTWNDPTPDKKYNVSYEYFLVSGSYLGNDHSWNVSDYPLADSEEYDYFHNMTYTCSEGDYIYYSNNSDGNSLYKCKVDGSGNMKLNSDKSYYMAAYGGWVYYSNYSNGGYIYKVRTDSTGNEMIYKKNSRDLNIEGNRLYYFDYSTGVQYYMELEAVEPPQDDYYDIDLDDWYEPFNERTNQPSDKSWTISFNKPVDQTAITEENIFVGEYDAGLLRPADVTVSAAGENKIVISPVYTWKNHGTYYLFVSEKIKSKEGKVLGKNLKMKFTVE